MTRLARSLPLMLSALWALPAMAQETTVIQAENVRFAYAQVLRVTPVYQTLTATSVEQRCDQTPRPDAPSGRGCVGAVAGGRCGQGRSDPQARGSAGELRGGACRTRVPPADRLRRRLRLQGLEVPLAAAR